MIGPIETKVKASAIGAGAGAIIASFILWLLDGAFFNGTGEPDVPLPLAAFVTLVVSTGLAFAAGYQAKHTQRPNLIPPAEGKRAAD